MELTPRLQAAADQVPQGARLADVGTDHGYLPVWLLLNWRIRRAIASDLRRGPLDTARENARFYGVTDRMDFRLCDGLTGIRPEEADAVTIAGMGGETIAAILAAAPWTKEDRTLVLQPMTSFPELRLWLQQNGYTIERETIAREADRLYTIWTVRGGEMPPLTPAELWAGRQSGDPLRRDYLDHMLRKVARALNGHRAAQSRNEAAITELEEVAAGLKTMREELP